MAAGIQHRQIVEVDPSSAQRIGDHFLAVYPVFPRPQLLVAETMLDGDGIGLHSGHALGHPDHAAIRGADPHPVPALDPQLRRRLRIEPHRLLGFTWRRRSEPMLMELMVWDL